MLLFSKRAKYIIYTFVIKVLNKKKKVLEEIKGIQFTKSAMITKKKRLANIFCKSTNLHKIQIADFHKCFETFNFHIVSIHVSLRKGTGGLNTSSSSSSSSSFLLTFRAQKQHEYVR